MQVHLGQPWQALLEHFKKIKPAGKACQHMAGIQADGQVQLIGQLERHIKRKLHRLNRQLAAGDAGLGQHLLQALDRGHRSAGADLGVVDLVLVDRVLLGHVNAFRGSLTKLEVAAGFRRICRITSEVWPQRTWP